MFFWHKRASASWLATNEPVLEIAGGENLAVVSITGRKQSLLQITSSTRGGAEELVRRFGGQFEMIARDWSPPHSSHPPIRIGRRLVIFADEPDANRSANSLLIPAAGAFGTGEHSTTAMSLRLLEEVTRSVPRGWRLLDVGTGTGILALAARRLGAAEALGLDNDPRATAHARANARLNHISRAAFLTADIRAWKSAKRHDFVTANLFSELLLDSLPVFRRALRKNGRLIVSGILRSQANEVVLGLCRKHFQVEKERTRGRWVALLASPKS